MHDAILAMIRKRRPEDQDGWDRALREVLQEAALAGLWRTGFFSRIAFYGGTALRLFHGLDRFSEDLDFSLLEPFPVSVRVVTLPCLFAGKLHACLCRSWKTRVKGRDWYDLLFFASQGVTPDYQGCFSKTLQ